MNTAIPPRSPAPSPAARSPFERLAAVPLTRRTVLGAGIGAATLATLAACATAPATAPKLVGPTSPAVAATEAARRGTGKITTVALKAAPTQLDLAGTVASTWSYGSVPAPVIRLGAGDTLRATLTNDLPDPTTVHWHGLALRNDMDGVPSLTQPAVPAGGTFSYDFIAPDPGTYWFHPHVGAQLDRGLYGALIVENPKEPLAYDAEWVVILDDWLDGVTATPDQVLQELSGGMGAMNMGGMLMQMGNMLMGTNSALLGGDTGDVFYPHYLINGKPPQDPTTFTAKPGNRVRIRFINAGGDTAFRVALGGHTLTITHTDGFPVQPTEVDSVLIGMGERYDVLVTLADGVFPLISSAEGKQAGGFAVVRTGGGATPGLDLNLPELLSQRVGTAGKLAATAEVTLARKSIDRELTLTLGGSMEKYDWSINGRRFDFAKALDSTQFVKAGERVGLNIVNTTMMWHPLHLHGHTYQHWSGGPRKDTSAVLPGQTLRVEFDADNPGQWLTHCHNIYHGEAGMMAVIGYRA